MYWPNGEKFAATKLPFVQNDDLMNQTSFYFGGFPVGQQGRLRLLTWLNRGGKTSEVIETFVSVKHTPIPNAAQEGIYTS